jgi:hypothetical protein
MPLTSFPHSGVDFLVLNDNLRLRLNRASYTGGDVDWTMSFSVCEVVESDDTYEVKESCWSLGDAWPSCSCVMACWRIYIIDTYTPN